MKIAIPVIVATVLSSAASAAPPAGNNPQDLVNIETAWSKAAVARDAVALSAMVAPDWAGQNEHGKIMDRAAMIKRTVSGDAKLSAMTNHDVHVRFIGNDHAIVQGMDNESGVTKGKKFNDVYSWTDIFEKRAGHWVAIASQDTPVK